MIQITLNFTTLALAIAALNQLNGSQLGAATIIDTDTGKAPAPAPKPARAEKAPAAPAPTPAAPAPSAPTAEAAPAAAPAEKPAPSVDYPTLQKAVFALAGKSREAAGAAAAAFGVKTFKDLDSGRWGEALAAVQAKTAELDEGVPA